MALSSGSSDLKFYSSSKSKSITDQRGGTTTDQPKGTDFEVKQRKDGADTDDSINRRLEESEIFYDLEGVAEEETKQVKMT